MHNEFTEVFVTIDNGWPDKKWRYVATGVRSIGFNSRAECERAAIASGFIIAKLMGR